MLSLSIVSDPLLEVRGHAFVWKCEVTINPHNGAENNYVSSYVIVSQCSQLKYFHSIHILLALSGALIAIRIASVLNTGLSLSEPLQLYQKQSRDSSAGYMYTLWEQQDITAR